MDEFFFFFQAEDGIRDWSVTGVQTCALPIFTYSKTETVVNGGPGSGVVVNAVYPNPFTDNFSFSYTAAQNQPVDVTILNTSGQEVDRKTLQAVKGNNDFLFNETDNHLETGIYFVKIKVDNVIHTQKVIKN